MKDIKALSASDQIGLANMILALNKPIKIIVEYENWRGVVAEREISPQEIWHGATEWHSEPGLMLRALDVEKNEVRDFRISDFDWSTAQVTLCTELK